MFKFYPLNAGTDNNIRKYLSNNIKITRNISRITATGGTIIDDAGYRMHIFTSPGSFVVSNAAGPGTVEYLVVAGGGGGGAAYDISPPSGLSSGGSGGSGIVIIRYPI